MSVILKQGFAPEEQYRQNGEQGPYTDVYALCATIYACVTGTVPVSSLDRLVEDTLQPPSAFGAKVLPHQEQALMHGLALSRKDRTPDMETLIREFTTLPAVKTALADEPVAPQPAVPPVKPSTAGNWQQPAAQDTPAAPATEPEPKKSKLPLLIAAIVVVVLIAGGVVAGVTLFGGGQSSAGNGASSSTSQISNSSSGSDTSYGASSVSSGTVKSDDASSNSANSVTADPRSVTTAGGETIVSDDAIDTGDVGAEMALRDYENYTGALSGNDAFDCSGSVMGNTVVYEFRSKQQLSDGEQAALKTKIASYTAEGKTLLDQLRKDSGVANAQIVYAFLNQDGSLIKGELIQ